MLNVILFALSMVATPVSSSKAATVSAPSCEWVGPRLDGVSVKVCSGEVKAYRDQAGNVVIPGAF